MKEINKIAPPRTWWDYLLLWIKGIVMGTANKVPGVSGGTAALVLGFYEEFIFSLRRINAVSLKMLFTGHFKDFWNYTNMAFLLCILCGTVTSFFSISLLIDYLMEHYSVQIWAVFFGMVIGSLMHLIRKYKAWSGGTVISMLIGLFIGISAGMLDYSQGSENMIIIFLCGVISVCGMTLPGLSGSFLLMIIGNYKLLMVDSVNAVFYAIKGLAVGDLTPIYDPVNFNLMVVCGVFTLGTIIGVITFSHILGYLLKRYPDTVVAVIIGFVAGSLGIMWPWKENMYDAVTLPTGEISQVVIGYDPYIPSLTAIDTWGAASLILAGILMVLWVESVGSRRSSSPQTLEK